MSRTAPALEGITNFRELGGIPAQGGRKVRGGRLFRSGHWGRASDADLDAMRGLGIGLVLDFRSETDVAHEGEDRLPKGVELVRLPTQDPANQTDTRSLVMSGDLDLLRRHFGDGRADQYMRESAAKLAAERTDVYARFLAELAEPDAPPALFHCSAGKDRAGWAASVVLLALGVDEQQVVAHYLLSNVHYDANHHHRDLGSVSSEIEDLLRPLIEVREEYVRASIEAAHSRFGSLDGYFREGLGLDGSQLEQLRENWLEPH